MKNFFTKKSTRREYEIISSDLENFEIPYISFNESIKISKLLNEYEKNINLLRNKIILLKKNKKFYLNSLFI